MSVVFSGGLSRIESRAVGHEHDAESDEKDQRPTCVLLESSNLCSVEQAPPIVAVSFLITVPEPSLSAGHAV